MSWNYGCTFASLTPWHSRAGFDAEDAHEVDLAVGAGVGRLRERIDYLPRALGHVERVGHQRLVALAPVGRHRRGGRLRIDVSDRITRLPARIQVVAGLAVGDLFVAHRPANLLRLTGKVKMSAGPRVQSRIRVATELYESTRRAV